jgi:hypothetical protein
MTMKGRILKSRGIGSALPELERMLATTAGRHVKVTKARRALVARSTRVAAIGLACLAFGGSAMAATGIWSPAIGTGSANGPATISDTPVPAALSAQLSVLRRDPTDQDRSAEVEATLRSASAPEGVRPDSVRYLGPGANGEATLLYSAIEASPFDPGEETVCVDRPMADWPETPAMCFGLSELLAGEAAMTVVHDNGQFALALGIVPDGVATVTAEFGGGPDVTVPVDNNYWELRGSDAKLSDRIGEAGVEHTVWRDAGGNVVSQQRDDQQ